MLDPLFLLQNIAPSEANFFSLKTIVIAFWRTIEHAKVCTLISFPFFSLLPNQFTCCHKIKYVCDHYSTDAYHLPSLIFACV